VKKVKVDLNKLTKRFLLGEAKSRPSVRAYVESVVSILEHFIPKSQRESRQLSVARQHLNEIKKLNRKLEEKITLLEEQVKVLEEGK
jgi:cell shape-determining protein MreC